MSALLPGSPVILTLGWTLLLSVWQTALIALLVWGGMRAARLASPALRHRLAMSGLVLALLCAAATFVWLARASVTPSPRVAERSRALNAAGGKTVDALAPLALQSSREPQRNATLGSLLPARLVAWAGVVWLVASAALSVRAFGGVLVVWRMRRRATPLRSTALREAVASLAQGMGVRRPVALLESSEIEAPAAVGFWRGALVFPQDLESSLAREHVEPIVVHELEHLRQRDPLVAAAQAAIDATLCLCPGARWLSSLARRTRELRCDDAAVRVCGNAVAYASALGALASLGCCDAPAPVLGVSGVSLVERIRRILKGEAMPRLNSLQLTGLLVGVVALGWSAPSLTGAALQQTWVEQQRSNPVNSTGASFPSGAPAGQPPMPGGYFKLLGNCPVMLRGVDSTAAYVFENVRVRNVSESNVVALTFLAIVETQSFDRPVVFVKSAPVQVSLAPGEAALLNLQMLSAKQATELRRDLGGPAQAMLALLSARDSDGTEWSLTPRPEARTAAGALYLKNDNFVSRSLIKSPPPPAPAPANCCCLDDRGFWYSRGAVVQILDENDHFARCAGRVWIDAGSFEDLAKQSDARPRD